MSASFPHVRFYIQPEGREKIENQVGTEGQTGEVDEVGPYPTAADAHPTGQPGADVKGRLFDPLPEVFQLSGAV
jgi:hypothetical protein